MANQTFDASFSEQSYISQLVKNFTIRAPLYNKGFSEAMHQDLIDTLILFHPPIYPVLDIACGTGLFARTLGNEGAGTTGLDITPAMLEIARQTAPKATFVEGRAEDLPFEMGVFGSVYSCSALVYFTDVGRVFKEAFRVLKEGGMLAYQAVTLDSYILGIALQAAVVEVLGEEEGLKVFCLPHGITDTAEANERLLKRAGFVDVKMKRVTVVSEMNVEQAIQGWDRLAEGKYRNPLTWKIGILEKGVLERVRGSYVRFLEERRGAGDVMQESVSSWYARGVKPKVGG